MCRRCCKVLQQFDEIFAVLKDDDAAKVRATVEWAKAEGLAGQDQPGDGGTGESGDAVG